MGQGTPSPFHVSASDPVRRCPGYEHSAHPVLTQCLGGATAAGTTVVISFSYVLGDLQDIQPWSMARNDSLLRPALRFDSQRDQKVSPYHCSHLFRCVGCAAWHWVNDCRPVHGINRSDESGRGFLP